MTAPDNTDARKLINKMQEFIDDGGNTNFIEIEHLITLHTKERELELQIYLLDKKLPSIIGYKNITSDIATRVSDQIIFLEAQLTNPTKGDNK